MRVLNQKPCLGGCGLSNTGLASSVPSHHLWSSWGPAPELAQGPAGLPSSRGVFLLSLALGRFGQASSQFAGDSLRPLDPHLYLVKVGTRGASPSQFSDHHCWKSQKVCRGSAHLQDQCLEHPSPALLREVQGFLPRLPAGCQAPSRSTFKRPSHCPTEHPDRAPKRPRDAPASKGMKSLRVLTMVANHRDSSAAGHLLCTPLPEDVLACPSP